MYIHEKYPYKDSILEEWNPDNLISEIKTITGYRNELNDYLERLEIGLKNIKPVKWLYCYSIEEIERYSLKNIDIDVLKTLPGYISDKNHMQGFIYSNYMNNKLSEYDDINTEFRLYKDNQIKMVIIRVFKYPEQVEQYKPVYFRSGEKSSDKEVWNHKDIEMENIYIPGIERLDKSGNENKILYEVIERLQKKYDEIKDLKTL